MASVEIVGAGEDWYRRIDDPLDQLDKTRYFTSLDLASGYWQIQVHQESIPKTAFITPQGLYEFKVGHLG
jgi:hypothetical protein